MSSANTPHHAPLPIDAIVPDVRAALGAGRDAVVVAAPGAGKSTRLAPALIDVVRGAVVLLQPRRVAARSIAARIAQERGWALGAEVGYHVRFDKRLGSATRVRVLTEGILARQLAADPFLDGIGCLILDEFHERSLHTDLTFALAKEIQGTVRPDLRLVVMSATMDAAPVATFLSNAPMFRSDGRVFPVDVTFDKTTQTIPSPMRAAALVREVLDGPSNVDAGHVLVFLPGVGEIRTAAAMLDGIDADVHLLHSRASSEDQDRALAPSPRRKVILATNIAETSLTIDGVRTVIDTGLTRVPSQDARLGIDRLELRRISRASADQRAGRAGRTAPGTCHRLWTLGEDGVLEAAEVPEIRRLDLASTILALHRYGVTDPHRFAWFEAPSRDAIDRAERLLVMLGAVATDGTLTQKGARLAELPLHPRLGALLVAGAERGLAPQASLLAALLSEGERLLSPPPGERRRAALYAADSDVIERMEALRPELSKPTAKSLCQVRDDLLRLVNEEAETAQPRRPASDDLMRLLLHAYPDRLSKRRDKDPSRGVMVGGRGVVLEASSVVRGGELFLSLDSRDTPDGKECRVALASRVEMDWLSDEMPHLLQRGDVCVFDEDRAKVTVRRREIFAGLVLSDDSSHATPDRAAAGGALFDGLRPRLARLLEGDEDVQRWLSRGRFLRRAMPDLGLPPFDDAFAAQALRDACAGRLSLDEVQRVGVLKNAMIERLDWKLRAALDEHAPESLAVPSGSRIRLDYPDQPTGSDVSAPVLAARLQELFGLAETPRVAGGRVPVVLQLLAPNHRPVQVTRDLKSFWNSTYQEVRKELRARYPKHPWPEDPWNAPPVAVGRKRRPS